MPCVWGHLRGVGSCLWPPGRSPPPHTVRDYQPDLCSQSVPWCMEHRARVPVWGGSPSGNRGTGCAAQQLQERTGQKPWPTAGSLLAGAAMGAGLRAGSVASLQGLRKLCHTGAEMCPAALHVSLAGHLPPGRKGADHTLSMKKVIQVHLNPLWLCRKSLLVQSGPHQHC